jgi:hypothetical protein
MLSRGISCSAREGKARQIRIRNNDRKVILKAHFQKRKDELRAEKRRRLRKDRQRQEDINEGSCDKDEGFEDADNAVSRKKEFTTRDTCCFIFCFVLFFIVYTLLVLLYLLPRQNKDQRCLRSQMKAWQARSNFLPK